MTRSLRPPVAMPLLIAAAGAVALVFALLSGSPPKPTRIKRPAQPSLTEATDLASNGTRLSIDPRVLHIDADSLVLVYTTRHPSVGRMTLISEFGKEATEEAQPTTHHRLEITGLVADTTYRYEVDGIHTGTVRTDRPGAVQTFAVFGHPGGTTHPGSFPFGVLAGALQAINPHFVLCTGDICNYTDQESFQERFFEPFRSLGQRTAIYAGAGNHERGFPARPRGHEYKVFRSLFPYSYGSPRGAFYSTVRGNVHLIAASYTRVDKRDQRDQLAWLKRELANSQSEFQVGFLGGGNPRRDGFLDELLKTFSEGGAEVVFGGDGAHSWHKKIQGMDFFFAGTNGLDPHDFYVVEVNAYELIVRKLNSAFTSESEVWSIPSKDQRPPLADLRPKLNPLPGAPGHWVARDFALDPSLAHGVRLKVTNPTESAVTIHTFWAPRPFSHNKTFGDDYRNRPAIIKAGITHTTTFALPVTDPLAGEPLEIGSIGIRFRRSDKGDLAETKNWIQQFEIFVDPLRVPPSSRPVALPGVLAEDAERPVPSSGVPDPSKK